MLPVITIAREYGSGGHDLAVALSDKLQLKLYDKELIEIATKQSGISKESFKNADERAGNSLLYSLTMGGYPYGITSAQNLPINDQLFILQSNIIEKAASEGPCIILGRCGNYILKNHPNVLRIYLTADKEYRKASIVRKGLTTEKKAADVISKNDKQRSNYYNFYTNQKWNDLTNYDIVINTSKFSIDEAVRIILTATGA